MLTAVRQHFIKDLLQETICKPKYFDQRILFCFSEYFHKKEISSGHVTEIPLIMTLLTSESQSNGNKRP